ncbi:MAG: ribosome maturation factor RimM [Campylobacterota bacterium]|nr:ribosome maturation factor RimM [Campylobacterota bacterium]
MKTIYVGKLGKTVGLKGQQKLHIDSDFPEQFKKDATFITNKKQTLTIETFNSSNNTVKFKGIDTIEDAKKLTNKELFVSQEDTKDNCKLDKNQYFWFDIENCEVIEDGEVLGKVIDIQRMPLEDYLLIETTKELQDQNLNKNFLVPYNDNYIVSVDIEKKQIVVQNCKEILEAS